MRFRQWLHGQFMRPTGFWGRVAGAVMAHRHSNRERNRWTVSLLDVRPNDRVLEIGFGPGLAIEAVSRIAVAGLVVGIDHSNVMVRQAAKRTAGAIREGRVNLILGSASELPAFEEPFDRIVAVNAMSFQNEAEAVERLQALRGLLRPGGLIALTVQPRGRGATDQTAQAPGAKLVTALTRAGFSQVRLETKPMKPVAAVCALGVA